MNQLSERAQALRAQMLASVSPAVKATRKTVKGQRAAAKVAKGKVAKAIKSVAATVREDMAEILGWTPPVSISQWLKRHADVNPSFITDSTVSDWGRRGGWSYAAMLDSQFLLAQARLRKEYQEYVNATFSQPIRFSGEGNAFDKIVKREEWLERQGKHDLGLLGYSAIDRVQIAVYYAWVKNVLRYLTQTGADKAFVKELGQALRDLRSNDDLAQLAELEGRSRYTVSGTRKDGSPRIRKQSQTEAVTQAARWLELRAEFDTFPVKEFAEYLQPSVGDVYQQLFAVTKEGLRQFRNTLEGLTQDGVISDATQFVAGHRHDLVSDGMDRMVAKLDASLKRQSAEDELFNRFDLDESFIKRRAVAAVALEMPNHTEAEANAKVAMQMLVEGMNLNELRESFSDLSEVAFGRLFTDSAIIAEEVQASDIFHVRFFDMVEEAATAAFTA